MHLTKLQSIRWIVSILLIASLQGCLGIEYFRSTYTSVCPGEVFALEFATNGADRVEIDPLPYDSARTPPGKGRAEVKIQRTTVFTIKASKGGGPPVTQTITVEAAPPPPPATWVVEPKCINGFLSWRYDQPADITYSDVTELQTLYNASERKMGVTHGNHSWMLPPHATQRFGVGEHFNPSGLWLFTLALVPGEGCPPASGQTDPPVRRPPNAVMKIEFRCTTR